jgi:hypothetical protein
LLHILELLCLLWVPLMPWQTVLFDASNGPSGSAEAGRSGLVSKTKEAALKQRKRPFQ